jgi:isopenicillin-N epimerase
MRASLWALDPSITFLNHGSFGACPVVVLEAERELRLRIEREPLRFFIRELEPLLDGARAELAQFVGADPRDLVFVANATSGVNAVVRSIPLESGDELVTTNHAYNACKNALEYAAARAGARVVVARVPFPITGPERVIEAVLGAVTSRTRLVLIDHVTSPTALVFPVREIVTRLAERGIDTMIDGAHAPGFLPLDVGAIGAAYYTANCHKWLCGPKGAGFLHVRRDRQDRVRPLAISHGANITRSDRSRFWLEFDWPGTFDPTPMLCVPAALRFMGALRSGGYAELMEDNRSLARAARARICDALGVEPPCPDAMIGPMASIPLPDGPVDAPKAFPFLDSLQDALFSRYAIEVPVFPFPALPKRLMRITAQAYNAPTDYERLCDALRALLDAA